MTNKPGTSTHCSLSAAFPSPCIAARERTLKRWQKERFERVFREDIRETEIVRALAQVELLGSLIPGRVGSPLSIRNLAEDVEASPKTIKSWIELLARNYYLFRVPPYHRRLERALKKEAKYFLWDWSEVKEEGPRFENMVALHLLKFCHYYEDSHGVDASLYYLRDLEKREVDFLVVWEGEPWFLVECKPGAPESFTHLRYFAGKLGLEQCYCVTASDRHDYLDRNTGGAGGAGRQVPHGPGLSQVRELLAASGISGNPGFNRGHGLTRAVCRLPCTLVTIRRS